MKKVIYKGTTQYPDVAGKIAIFSSDGKKPIEMPDEIADTLIARGRAVEVKDDEEESAEPQKLQVGKGKKGKKAPEGDKVPEGDKNPEDGSNPV